MTLLALALHVVDGTTWPPEIDHYRDMAAAQSMLDGQFGSDSAFKGELQWYSPLVPAVGAGIAGLLRSPLPLVWARMGPYLNLLAPLTFYLFARLLMAPMAATSALAGFLFLGSPEMDLGFQATYSPWMWPNQFVQAFFYAAAASFLVAVRNGRARWEAATGLLLGVTFLGHVAPALILSLGFAVHTVWSVCSLSGTPAVRSWRRLGLCVAVSGAVVTPFLAPLLFRYGLHMKNEVPARSVFIGWPEIVMGGLRPRGLIALLGGAVLLHGYFERPAPDDRRVVLALGGASLVTLLYGLLVAALDRRAIAHLPLPVPSFHFHFYLKAFECLLFGLGLALLMHHVPRLAPRARIWVMAVAVVAAVSGALPRYLQRRDVVRWPPESRRLANDRTRIALYEWARLHLSERDVTLAPFNLSMFALLPAGRHVVALIAVMASPYVDAAERQRDQSDLFHALGRHDLCTFERLARKYGLTHIVAGPADEGECCALSSTDIPESFRLVLDVPSLRVYAVPSAFGANCEGG